MSSHTIVSTPDRFVEAIESELKRWLSVRPRVGRHYDLLSYHMGWADEDLSECVAPRGKRFRPLMCLLACDVVGGSHEDALPVAASLEFLHNFSLIHDDIEDHDESRRHRPTLWKLWGDPLAINAGDAMLALAGLAALSAPNHSSIARRFQETALALTEGQYLDMTFETQNQVSVDEYLEMIGLKTAALIECSSELGAVVGGGRPEQIESLRQFGHAFGLAYQIFDDLRGIWAAEAETGKSAGKDIANRKKSLPVLLALEASSGTTRDELVAYYVDGANTPAKNVIELIDSLNIRPLVELRLQQHLSQAIEYLHGESLKRCGVENLEALALSLVAGNQPA